MAAMSATQALGRVRSERPQWRTFDFYSIWPSATGVEVFDSALKNICDQ